MEFVLSLCVGIGLSAACGFRVFVPFMVMSVASLTGQLSLDSGFDWIGSYYALAAFATATLVEVLAYYIPWVDNALDTIATPAAVIAGAVVSASIITGISPLLKWSLAIIAGGGSAGAVQMGTVALRAASTATTGGIGNFVVSTAELVISVLTTILAILLPVLAILMLLIGGLVVARMLRFVFTKRRAAVR